MNLAHYLYTVLQATYQLAASPPFLPLPPFPGAH